jgi:hypothetical protein
VLKFVKALNSSGTDTGIEYRKYGKNQSGTQYRKKSKRYSIPVFDTGKKVKRYWIPVFNTSIFSSGIGP